MSPRTIPSIGWSLSGMGMSGTFTLTQNGQTTTAIAWNASEATILAALESLSSIGAGNIVVDAPVPSGSTYSRTIGLTFRNAKYGIDLPQTTINTTGLVPGYGSITPFGTTTANGGIYSETQTIALANATGGTWRLAYNGEIRCSFFMCVFRLRMSISTCHRWRNRSAISSTL